jgi:hypothetical protein
MRPKKDYDDFSKYVNDNNHEKKYNAYNIDLSLGKK